MNRVVELIRNNSNSYNENPYFISAFPEENGYTFVALVNDGDTYEDIINDSDKIKKHFELIGLVVCEEEREIIEKAKKEIDVVLENIPMVTLHFSPEEAAEYIKKSPLLRRKDIVFKDYFDLDIEKVKKYEDLFEDTSKLYFDVEGNSMLISFDEYKQTVEIIDNIVKDIKSYNYSPFETVMHVFDIVRDKVYKMADGNEIGDVSRDLSSVLTGDKIVCLGYARIFNTILNKLGFKTREQFLKGINGYGHSRSEVYIKDEKYDIDGVFFFDPTWNSKKDSNDKSFLSSYLYFAREKDVFDRFDSKRYVDINMPYPVYNISEAFEKELETKSLSEISDDLYDTLDYMSTFVNNRKIYFKKLAGLTNNSESSSIPPDKIINALNISEEEKRKMIKRITPTNEDIIEEVRKLDEMYNEPIPASKLIEALLNVRKKQYYRNPDKYPFTREEFKNIYLNSRWLLPKDKLLYLGKDSSSYKLISDIFGIDIDLEGLTSEQIIEEHMSNNEIDKDIERIRLTKTLDNISKKKSI